MKMDIELVFLAMIEIAGFFTLFTELEWIKILGGTLVIGAYNYSWLCYMGYGKCPLYYTKHHEYKGEKLITSQSRAINALSYGIYDSWQQHIFFGIIFAFIARFPFLSTHIPAWIVLLVVMLRGFATVLTSRFYAASALNDFSTMSLSDVPEEMRVKWKWCESRHNFVTVFLFAEMVFIAIGLIVSIIVINA
jgi:hypothetical protein